MGRQAISRPDASQQPARNMSRRYVLTWDRCKQTDPARDPACESPQVPPSSRRPLVVSMQLRAAAGTGTGKAASESLGCPRYSGTEPYRWLRRRSARH
jgi:hypothetical protein